MRIIACIVYCCLIAGNAFSQTTAIQDQAVLNALKSWVQAEVPTIQGPIGPQGPQGPIGLSGTSEATPFLPICDGITDDTIAFQNMAAAIQSTGGGIIEFPKNKQCIVYSSVGINQYLVLMQFRNISGVKINYNGSKLVSPAVNLNGSTLILHYLWNSTNIEINGPNWQQSDIALQPFSGATLIYIVDGTKQVIVNNAIMIGGKSAIEATRSAKFNRAERASGILVNGLRTTNVFYPLAFERNGDNFIGRNIETVNAGRSYIPYNVRFHDINLIATGHGTGYQDVTITAWGNPLESAIENTTSDIRLRYSYVSTLNELSAPHRICFVFQQADQNNPGPAAIRNIDIQMELDFRNTATPSPVICTYKQLAGVPDPIARGHILDNINLHGTVDYSQNSIFADLFNDTNWSGEKIRNFSLNNLVITGGSSINIDGRGLQGIMDFSLIYAPNTAINWTNRPFNAVISRGTQFLNGTP